MFVKPVRITPALVMAALLGARAPAAIINVPGDQPTITDAVAVAMSGDEILVAPGTYDESFFILSGITVRSSDGPAVTTITNTSSTPITVLLAVTVAIEGFMFTTGGLHTGISALSDAQLILTDCRFVDCAQGVIVDASSSASMSDCEFDGNRIGAIVAGISPASSIVDCIFRNHQEGALSVTGTNTMVLRCLFENNTNTMGPGGALSIGGGNVTDCIFSVNSSTQEGGAISYTSGLGRSLVVTDCHFEGNSASAGGGGSVADATVTGCTFIDNTATTTGGALTISENATILGCQFISNTAGNSGGGLIVPSGTSGVSITDTVFCQNMPDNLVIDGLVSAANVLVATPGTDCNQILGSFGACCLPQGGCVSTTEASCLSAGGTFQGDGVLCVDAMCPGPCAGDANNDLVVNFNDVNEVLANWLGMCP